MIALFFVLVFSVVSTRTQLVSGRQLQFCRELDYAYTIDPAFADKLGLPPDDPFRLDRRLGELALEIAGASSSQQCMFDWKQLMCSSLFRAPDRAPPCAALCGRATASCFQPFEECDQTLPGEPCTDYAVLTRTYTRQCSLAGSAPSPPAPLPPNGGGSRPPPPRSSLSSPIRRDFLITILVLISTIS